MSVSKPESIEVLISNFETWPLAARAVRSIIAVEPSLPVLRIVDDGSRSSPPAFDVPVLIERNDSRLGLVRSLDGALRRSQADLVLLLDSDAFPTTSFCRRLAEAFAEEERLAVVGFRTTDERGGATGSYEPSPGAASLILGQRLSGWVSRVISARDPEISVYACAMAIRRKAYIELGGFDIGLDWLDLDHDLCMKAWEGGWIVRHDPELVAVHEGSGAPQSTEDRVRRFYCSRWRLLRNHGRIRSPRLVRALVLARLRVERVLLLGLTILSGSRREHWRRKLEGRRELIELVRTEWR